ncbi:MAG: hypothetical protein EA425_06375, partial [Puniceicoccaceae bacterium]
MRRPVTTIGPIAPGRLIGALATAIGLGLLTGIAAAEQPVVINELSSSNSRFPSPAGDTPDWIELFNRGPDVADLSFWGLTDDPGDPFQWRFPPGTLLEPQSHLVIWASGVAANQTLADHPLLPAGASWRYHQVGESLPLEWQTPEFDDSTWQTGPAPLGHPKVVGHRPIVATLTHTDPEDESPPAPTLFRHAFNADSTDLWQSLHLYLRSSDGVIVTLNGVEIVRRNLPEDALSASSTALTTIPSPSHELRFELPVELILPGSNILAAAVFPSETSSSLIFDLRLLARVQAEALHASFRISRHGEPILLTRPDGSLADEVPPIALGRDVSMGRLPDGGEKWRFFDPPTPGLPNSGGQPAVADAVQFSRPGATVRDPFSLSLLTTTPGGVIRYTRDGSLPTKASPAFQEPLTIDTTQLVRARVFAPGHLPGPVVSHHYLFLDAGLDEFSSNLPLVIVDTLGAQDLPASQPDHPGYLFFLEPDEDGRTRLEETPAIRTRAGLRRRGQSSMRSINHKPNLALEAWFDDRDEDRPIAPFGLPEESDWILYAPDLLDP